MTTITLRGVAIVQLLKDKVNLYPGGEDVEVNCSILQAEEVDIYCDANKLPITFIGYTGTDAHPTQCCFSVAKDLKTLTIREGGR